MEDVNHKRNGGNKITIVILMIVIIILLLLIFFLLKKGLLESKHDLIPTGNVDIFEIECIQNCECIDNSNNNISEEEQESDKESSSATVNSNSNNYSSGNNNEETTTTNDGVEVYDDNIIWKSTNKLSIFENPVYQMDSMIAPLSTNSYQFVIKNNTANIVTYQLNFTEINNYNINMKYRLKRNGVYVAGSNSEWVTYDKLNISILEMNSTSKDTYYLEWKWFESDNDTMIGSIQSDYSLNITLSAQQKV